MPLDTIHVTLLIEWITISHIKSPLFHIKSNGSQLTNICAGKIPPPDASAIGLQVGHTEIYKSNGIIFAHLDKPAFGKSGRMGKWLGKCKISYKWLNRIMRILNITVWFSMIKISGRNPYGPPGLSSCSSHQDHPGPSLGALLLMTPGIAQTKWPDPNPRCEAWWWRTVTKCQQLPEQKSEAWWKNIET